jgi:hypothetical protein
MLAAQAGGKEAAKAEAVEEAGASTIQTERAEQHHRTEHPRPEVAREVLEPGQVVDRTMELGSADASLPRRSRGQTGVAQQQQSPPREAAHRPSREPPRQLQRTTEPEETEAL